MEKQETANIASKNLWTFISLYPTFRNAGKKGLDKLHLALCSEAFADTTNFILEPSQMHVCDAARPTLRVTPHDRSRHVDPGHFNNELKCQVIGAGI
jgi:hypothetical protein